MITLEQITTLDQKVRAAVQLIQSLRGQNAGLTSKLDQYQKRIDELEVLIAQFRQDQGEIENGILRALEHLDTLEDTLVGESSPAEEDKLSGPQPLSGPPAAAERPSPPVEEEPAAPPQNPPESDDAQSEAQVEDSQEHREAELDIF